MNIDTQTISEVLEVLGRAAREGELVLLPGAGPRLLGANRLLVEAAGALDRPPEGGWPGSGTVAQRRAEAHLNMINEDALAWLTRAAREGAAK